MGIAKKTRKYAQTKRMITNRDSRLKKNQAKEALEVSKKKSKSDDVVREMQVHNHPIPKPFNTNRVSLTHSPQQPSALFFQHNTSLVPPYSVLVDTNFLSHTVQHKLDLLPTMMDCLLAKCTPIITSCVMAELEKLGTKYRIALRIARDERWERLKCSHRGVYADDCIVDRVVKHRVYIVATNDKDLKNRLRKIPGVPIMSVARGKYVIERLPDAPDR
ncbi:MAG: hypothetical protein M1820_000487 [Bogoriella megaspora]|nr:MAG: hypothetical protein M1820_000487 [Bogoriella megaspora]